MNQQEMDRQLRKGYAWLAVYGVVGFVVGAALAPLFRDAFHLGYKVLINLGV